MYKKISFIGATALTVSFALAFLSGCGSQANVPQNGSRVPASQPTSSQTGPQTTTGSTTTGNTPSTTTGQNQSLSQLDQTLGNSFNDLSTSQQNADNSTTPAPTEAQP